MILGNESQFEALSTAAREGTLAHAHVFIGPKHVGKTRMAMELAVILQQGEENPALRRQILEGYDADTLLYLDRGEPLSIKEIRELRERLAQSHLRPHLVVVIENLGRMKVEAMNALLKTLEEPTEGTIFFLTVHREEDLLPTIRSRCQVSYFHTVADSILKAHTESAFADKLVSYAMGRPGKWFRLQHDESYFELHQTLHQEVLSFLERPSVPGAFALARTHEKSEHLEEFLDILLHRTRTLALSPGPDSAQRQILAERLEQIEASKEDLRGNVNARLVLENLLLSFVS